MIGAVPQGAAPQDELRPVEGAVTITGGNMWVGSVPGSPLGVPDKTAVPAGSDGSLS